MSSKTPWRNISAQYAKGEGPPMSVESLQAAWERDQELMLEQAEEIGRLKAKINQVQQKLAAARRASK